jgi:transcriptional regulator with XRE-family HTH domain
MSFTKRLREEIEFSGLLHKEIAEKANIKKRAFDMYVGAQGSIPPADIAVRIAKVLGVTVEYLVTGEDRHAEGPLHPEARRLLKLFATLDARDQETVMSLIESMAERYANSSGKDMSSPHAG